MQSVVLTAAEQSDLRRVRERMRQRAGRDLTPAQVCAATDVLATARRLPRFAPDFGEPRLGSYLTPPSLPLPLAEPHAGALRLRALALLDGRFQACTADEAGRLRDCGDIAQAEVKRWLGADEPAGEDRLFPVVAPQRDDGSARRRMEHVVFGERDLTLSVPDNEWLHVRSEPSTRPRRLQLTLLGEGSRVIVTGTVSAGDTIELRDRTPHGGQDEAERVDARMITGCLTLLDTRLEGGTLSVQDAHCEDSVNLIRARGRLDRVQIADAAQDALDADFSDFEIARVQVKGAGNDCIDVSYGRYRFGQVQVEGCTDKGASVGERSQARFESLQVRSSDQGVVGKDLARVTVVRLDADVRKNCISAYQKKSEHGGGSVHVHAMSCRGKVSHDDVSTVEVPAR